MQHLTTREVLALQAVADHGGNLAMAQRSFGTARSFEFHLQNARRKLAVRTTLEALVAVAREGVVDLNRLAA